MADTVKTYIGIQPDQARFFIPVEMDRPRVLAFDNAATFLIYQKYGGNFFYELYEHDPNVPAPTPAEKKQGKGMPIRLRSHEAFEFFLWAALQRDAKAAGEALTLEHVADQIVPTTISDLAQSLFVALAATRKPAPLKNA